MRSEWDNVDYYFGRRLDEALKAKGLERKDLDDLGIISQSSLHEYIDCGRLPNLRTACRLAEFLDVDLNWLCGFNEELKWSDASMQRQLKAPWLQD